MTFNSKHIRWIRPKANSYLLLFVVLCVGIGLSSELHAQNRIDSIFLKPVRIVKDLPSFTEIDVDSEGNLILMLPGENRMFKYFVQAAYDSSISVGGRGVGEEGFLNVAKISARNRQNTYLLDDVKRRIVIFNTRFKVISELDFQDLNGVTGTVEIYPLSFDVSPGGDQFILNQQDNKIYKISSFSEVESEFGGLDYGEGSLYQPVDIQVREDNLLLVSDTSAQEMTAFDFYGIYQFKYTPKADFRWKQFALYQHQLICFDEQRVYLENMRTGQYRNFRMPIKKPVLDLSISKELIYLLFENEVHLYKY